MSITSALSLLLASNVTGSFISLKTGANNYTYFSETGNVGINTTATPAAKFAVNGGAHIGGESDPGDNNLLVDGIADVVGTLGVSGIATINNNLTVLGTMCVTGGIGVGTAPTSGLIHVKKDYNGSTAIYVENMNTDGSGTSELRLKTSSGTETKMSMGLGGNLDISECYAMTVTTKNGDITLTPPNAYNVVLNGGLVLNDITSIGAGVGSPTGSYRPYPIDVIGYNVVEITPTDTQYYGLTGIAKQIVLISNVSPTQVAYVESHVVTPGYTKLFRCTNAGVWSTCSA
jgi:hypothetical protein